jgi:hypothetical protein
MLCLFWVWFVDFLWREGGGRREKEGGKEEEGRREGMDGGSGGGGGGVGVSDELALMWLCALSYTAMRVACHQQ